MKYFELLHDYVDGTLPADQEGALFHELAVNDELRLELKELLAMKNAIAGDIPAFTPPAESTMKIFSAIGFSAPPPVLPFALGASAGAGGIMLWFSRYSQAIYSGVASAALTALAFTVFLMTGKTETNAIATGNSVQQPQVSVPQNPSVQREIPISSSREVVPAERPLSSKRAGNNVDSRIVFRQIPTAEINNGGGNITKTQSETVNNGGGNALLTIESEETQQPKNEQISLVEPKIVQSDVIENRSSKTDKPAQISISAVLSQFFDIITPENSDYRYSMEIRGISAQSVETASITSSSNPAFKNMAIGAFYAVTPNHSVGLEFGQESYFQKFEGSDIAGKRFMIEQNPLLPWTGLVYRFTPITEGSFQPFGQLTFGGTEVGMLARSMAGIRFTPESRITFSLGAEYTSMFYRHQNLWHSSPKFGLSYGMSVKF